MYPASKTRVRISPGFVLLIAWFGLINGGRMLWTLLSAAAIHECGHWLVLRALSAEILELRIGACGAVLETDSRYLSYSGELAAALAGPGANLLAASVLTWYGLPEAAGAHLILAGFNLLPIPPLDGGRALHTLLTALLGPGERISGWIGRLTAWLLAGAVTWLVIESGGSLWLLPGAIGILLAARQM